MESQKFIVDGKIIAEKSSSSLGFGFLYNFLSTMFNENNIMKMQLASGPVIMGESLKTLQTFIMNHYKCLISSL